MRYLHDTFTTPCGPFSIALDETGAIAVTAFGEVSRMGRWLHSPDLKRDVTAVAPARQQIMEYFAGERSSFDLPLAPQGTPFQLQVWEALLAIPYGVTRNYGEIAAQVGNARACRAVGRANGANPICLIIPCHRVIGADGSMTGFGFGEKIKRQLLEHEGSQGDVSSTKPELLFV